MVFQIQIA